MPKIIQYRYPISLAIRNLVQLVLHLRGKPIVDIARKVLRKEANDNPSNVGRLKSFLIQHRIFTRLQCRDNAGVG